MKKSIKIIMLLSIFTTNNIFAVKNCLITQVRKAYLGRTHQEDNSPSNESASESESDATSDYSNEANSDYEMVEPTNQPDALAEEYHDEITLNKNDFDKFQNRATCVGLSGLCLVAGVAILIHKLSSY